MSTLGHFGTTSMPNIVHLSLCHSRKNNFHIFSSSRAPGGRQRKRLSIKTSTNQLKKQAIVLYVEINYHCGGSEVDLNEL